jgi:hypothetical protein
VTPPPFVSTIVTDEPEMYYGPLRMLPAGTTTRKRSFEKDKQQQQQQEE